MKPMMPVLPQYMLNGFESPTGNQSQCVVTEERPCGDCMFFVLDGVLYRASACTGRLCFGRFSYMQLRSLSENVFAGLDIATIILSGNQLTSLGGPKGNSSSSVKYLSGLQNLVELDLSWNEIESLDEDTFQGLENLRQLSLVGNNFVSLPDNIFSKLKNLVVLNLGYNRLLKLPKSLTNLTELTFLFLEYNPLSPLNEDAFSGLSLLEHLSIWQNGLRTLPVNIFSGLSKLRSLSLKRNYLAGGIQNGTLSFLKLNSLAIDIDCFSKLPKDEIDLSSLTTLYVDSGFQSVPSSDCFPFNSSKLEICTFGSPWGEGAGRRLMKAPVAVQAPTCYGAGVLPKPVRLCSGTSSVSTELGIPDWLQE
jgi:hypothetical protein